MHHFENFPGYFSMNIYAIRNEMQTMKQKPV